MHLTNLLAFFGLWLAAGGLVYGAQRRAFRRIQDRSAQSMGRGGEIFVSALAGLILAMVAMVAATFVYHGLR
ncbi:hypothetical protein [Rubritepida flocculans]|uniref:hypothetical protein n=1 Tax=Rubritepida flocculans TaxID=182403 RepID=UPI0003F7DAFA|nr:hypothetical protein [Rubritepida flocculans]